MIGIFLGGSTQGHRNLVPSTREVALLGLTDMKRLITGYSWSPGTGRPKNLQSKCQPEEKRKNRTLSSYCEFTIEIPTPVQFPG